MYKAHKFPYDEGMKITLSFASIIRHFKPMKNTYAKTIAFFTDQVLRHFAQISCGKKYLCSRAGMFLDCSWIKPVQGGRTITIGLTVAFAVLLLSISGGQEAYGAESSVQTIHLSAEDRDDVSRIEDYLNDLKSIGADFMEIDENGGIQRGTIAIQRPGKMRVNYNPPSRDFIVADGNTVHIWNDDLQEQTNIDESSSLAEFILRDPVRLSGDVVITKLQRFPAKIELTLVEANDPAAGALTLIFEDRPLKLRQWRVLDPQGHVTGVNLENEHEGPSFTESTFTFVPPNFGRSNKAQEH
jgi:outer membrane lipoprotein-sorting protein